MSQRSSNSPTPNKDAKPVIIAGFAPSRGGIEDLDPTIEMWSVNHAWQFFQEEKLHAVFELHPYAHLQHHAYYGNADTERLHKEFLAKPHNFPIYMIEAYPDVPAAVRYPIEDALELAGNRYFSSSFAYMFALAMLQGRNPIYVYGFDMATDTEWYYQRPNCEWWVGFAEGKGFEVIISKESPLCKVKKMYGYEGYQMIDRGVLEERKKNINKQFQLAREQFDRWQGILLERDRLMKAGKLGTRKEAQALFDEAANQCRNYEGTASMCDGAIQILNNLLDECDLVPTDIPVFGMLGVRGKGLEK